MTIASDYQGKRVLVTGGTGTIGLEIVRQVLRHDPEVVRIFSRDETKQAYVREQLPENAPVRFLIGDIRDAARLSTAVEGVHTVFHAAALKHVPACEYNPFEAVQTNVMGTQNLLLACREQGVARLVGISTDKAVNPANTMGATKLLAESVLRDASSWNPDLQISAVRFGNVLGSRGSLIPMLVNSMEEERRVTVTHPDMTRFMMTIGDAVGLVLEAAAASRGGEICILKMPSLRIGDLVDVFAREYSRRRGWDPAGIRIETRGIRAGEKFHEELVTASEIPRLEERENMYVVQPHHRAACAARTPGGVEIPEDCDSGRAPLLDESGILELLERAGVLPTMDASVHPPEAEVTLA